MTKSEQHLQKRLAVLEALAILSRDIAGESCQLAVAVTDDAVQVALRAIDILRHPDADKYRADRKAATALILESLVGAEEALSPHGIFLALFNLAVTAAEELAIPMALDSPAEPRIKIEKETFPGTPDKARVN